MSWRGRNGSEGRSDNNTMKITSEALTKLETERNLLTVQSHFDEIAYVVDRRNKAMWVVNRQTGAQLEVSAENVHMFADEVMSVADVHLRKRTWEKGA